MADNLPTLGVRATAPIKAPDVPPLPPPPPLPSDPPAWPPLAQWCTAGLLGLSLALLAWHGWGLSRYSTRPLPLERAGAQQPEAAQAYQEPPPRIARGKVDDAPPARGKKKPPETPLDLNRASAAELMQLPGIGPALSARIVAARPFRHIDDLRRVRGIGPRTLEAIRPHVLVGGE